MGHSWIVKDDGQCYACPVPRDWDLLETPYHFHRFLTEVEDLLRQGAKHSDDCLPELHRLVRKLVLNSYWLQTQRPELAQREEETSVLNLYDEIGYPLTVQVESRLPGSQSPVHNHGTWGIVAVLQGRESNQLWHPDPTPAQPDKISAAAEKVLMPGDIISFTPAAIHSIQAVSEVPLVTFNLYGETHSKRRFEFDLVTQQAKNY